MRRAGNLALIVIGGGSGAMLRASVAQTFPAAPGQWPWATFWINVGGSLLLGLLLELLSRADDVGWRRSMRLGLGTGVLGGFTTYSTFSVETVELLRSGLWLPGISYALISVLVGIGAALLGMMLARQLRPNREAR